MNSKDVEKGAAAFVIKMFTYFNPEYKRDFVMYLESLRWI